MMLTCLPRQLTTNGTRRTSGSHSYLTARLFHSKCTRSARGRIKGIASVHQRRKLLNDEFKRRPTQTNRASRPGAVTAPTAERRSVRTATTVLDSPALG